MHAFATRLGWKIDIITHRRQGRQSASAIHNCTLLWLPLYSLTVLQIGEIGDNLDWGEWDIHRTTFKKCLYQHSKLPIWCESGELCRVKPSGETIKVEKKSAILGIWELFFFVFTEIPDNPWAHLAFPIFLWFNPVESKLIIITRRLFYSVSMPKLLDPFLRLFMHVLNEFLQQNTNLIIALSMDDFWIGSTN